ncbi:MAG: hypothetical protein MUE69_28510 [Myxococcota bacterium]|nr:hypothetical protein [Myxococcota bacterium]
MEERLVEYARYTTASQLERICRGVRQQQLLDTEVGEPVDEAERLRRAFGADVVERGDAGVLVVYGVVVLRPFTVARRRALT